MINPDLGTEPGETCNRLGCDGVMGVWDIGWIDEPDPVMCSLCGYGPGNEMPEPDDDYLYERDRGSDDDT